MSFVPRNLNPANGKSPLYFPNFLTRISCALTCSLYRGQSQQLGHGRMKTTGRTISAPTRRLLLNLLVEERAGTLGRTLLCRRCLRSLHSYARSLQSIRHCFRREKDMILSYPAASGMKKLGEDIWQHHRHGHSQLCTKVRCSSALDSNRPTARVQYRTYVMKGALTHDTVPKSIGPLEEYDERVHSRRLRDDEHQRCTVATAQERWKSVS